MNQHFRDVNGLFETTTVLLIRRYIHGRTTTLLNYVILICVCNKFKLLSFMRHTLVLEGGSLVIILFVFLVFSMRAIQCLLPKRASANLL